MGNWTPALGWKRIALDTWKDAGKDNLSLVAAGVAFYAFLAFVPLLTALILSYGLFAEPLTVARDIGNLAEILPASAASIAADQLEAMTEGSDAKTGLALILSLAIAVYGASKAADAIMTALNIVYGVKECRGFVGRLLTALGMTASAVFLLLLAVATVSALSFLEGLLPGLGGVTAVVLRLVFILAAGAVMMGLLALIYRFVPCRPERALALDHPGLGDCHSGVAAADRRLRSLRRQFRQLQRHLRLARRGDRLPHLALPHGVHHPPRRRAQCDHGDRR